MAIKAEGIWGCTVLSAIAGRDNGSLTVEINVRIDEGPSKGMRGTYRETVDNRSLPYAESSCKAAGWTAGNAPSGAPDDWFGRNWSSLQSDVAKWIAATGGKTTCEVKHIAIKKGKQYDKWVADGMKGEPPVWDKIKSLGRGAARALEPLESFGGAPPADAPMSDDSDIPFISSSMYFDMRKAGL